VVDQPQPLVPDQHVGVAWRAVDVERERVQPHHGRGELGVDRGERALGVRAQRLGRRRRHHPAADPHEQLGAQRALERADLLGHRGLGVAELLGRGGQGADLVGGEEAAQLLERQHRRSLGYPKETQATPIAPAPAA